MTGYKVIRYTDKIYLKSTLQFNNTSDTSADVLSGIIMISKLKWYTVNNCSIRRIVNYSRIYQFHNCKGFIGTTPLWIHPVHMNFKILDNRHTFECVIVHFIIIISFILLNSSYICDTTHTHTGWLTNQIIEVRNRYFQMVFPSFFTPRNPVTKYMWFTPHAVKYFLIYIAMKKCP